ncbi:MAG: trypsin-like serine protease, partial [Phycisphaerae bacterium]|nr:trypsin-like serine protease [Phycisphaerae bacterium]
MAKASTAATLLAFALAACLHGTASPAWGIVVSDDPSLHVVTAPSAYDGVAYLSSVSGASAVLVDPWYVLTAKHAVFGWTGHTATFHLESGPVVFSLAEVFTYPTADVAVVRLNRNTGLDGYSLYDPSVYGTESGKVGVVVGYGMSGTPATVQAGGDPNYPRGTLRVGYNRIDSIDPNYGTSGQCLQMDFDSPSSGGPNGSLGADKEVMVAYGDSGGPVFINAGGSLRVAGIHSTLACYDPNHWPKYGDYSFHVRASAYAGWIDSVIADIPAPLTGDFNNDSSVNATDIDALFAHYGSADLWYDVSGDSIIGWADSNDLIRTMLGTEYGDANLDLRVDIDDYNLLAANFGLTGGWAKGDFNGDKKVN